MRVLQINKYFYPHAGSETVFFHTRRLLADHGHEVMDFAMRDERNVESPYSEYFAPYRNYTDASRSKPARVSDAVASVYSPSARSQLRRLLHDHRPDVAHLHVVYHQLTLSIVDELAAQGVPSVLTLHDYKIGCPAYVLYRDGHVCDLCVSGPPENVLKHKCIKGSRAASLLAAAEARLVRTRRIYNKIDAFVAPSAFAGQVAIRTGIDPATVHVVPNFLPEGEIGEPVAALADEPRFFFAGRLEKVKGVHDLLRVWGMGDPALGTLAIAGVGGELEGDVRTAAAASGGQIEYLGRLTREQVGEQVRRSRAMVLTSRWHENNPMSILEARSHGVPVIVSDMGGLPEMVSDGVDGLVVRSGDDEALAAAARRLAGDREGGLAMGRAGYRRLRDTNAPEPHYVKLMAAYEAAIARHPAPAGA